MDKVVLASEVDFGSVLGQILGHSAKNFGVIAVIVCGAKYTSIQSKKSFINNTHTTHIVRIAERMQRFDF